ncbi:uncharacterized protein LOC123313649 [Coccinella septempunctata]|uniref:uncharacterized protein LOC123313649 n=1 Tax=Coccinella septempunctata TaxID=41139 RepID=UPI001D093F58|nr:uncharacterized protein LOC123313649 [Coccinella septempunctata]
MSSDQNINEIESSNLKMNDIQSNDLKPKEVHSSDLNPNESQSSDLKLDEEQSSSDLKLDEEQSSSKVNLFDSEYSDLKLNEIQEGVIMQYLEDNKCLLQHIIDDTELDNEKILLENLASKMAEVGSTKSVELWKDTIKKMKINSERQAFKYYRYSQWTDNPIRPTPIAIRFIFLSKELKILAKNPGAGPDPFKDIESMKPAQKKEFFRKKSIENLAEMEQAYKINKTKCVYRKKLLEMLRAEHNDRKYF